MLTESGSSGPGKTTLLNLIMQTWDDYKGNILFDGVELRSIPPTRFFRFCHSYSKMSLYLTTHSIITSRFTKISRKVIFRRLFLKPDF